MGAKSVFTITCQRDSITDSEKARITAEFAETGAKVIFIEHSPNTPFVPSTQSFVVYRGE